MAPTRDMVIGASGTFGTFTSLRPKRKLPAGLVGVPSRLALIPLRLQAAAAQEPCQGLKDRSASRMARSSFSAEMPPLTVSLPEGIIRKSTSPTPRPSSPYVTCIGVSECTPRLDRPALCCRQLAAWPCAHQGPGFRPCQAPHFAATFEVMLPVLSTSATSGPAMGRWPRPLRQNAFRRLPHFQD